MHGRFSIIGVTCPGCPPKCTPMPATIDMLKLYAVVELYSRSSGRSKIKKFFYLGLGPWVLRLIVGGCISFGHICL